MSEVTQERVAAVVHDWLTAFHNKEYTATERIDKLVAVIGDLLEEDRTGDEGE